MPPKTSDNTKRVAENRRARYDYDISETYEAGIMLKGTEVKALRQGKANLTPAFVRIENEEAYLVNAEIPEYSAGNRENHKPTRTRKLLLSRKEITKLAISIQQEGGTVVPLKLYFSEKGLAKLLIGNAKGRRKVDKRQNEKKRDWQIDKARLMRDKG